MPLRVDERATDLREIDRFEGGVGWIAHPAERMQRASYAFEIDGGAWVVDPVDADPLDDLLETVGPVEGVVLTLKRHRRDAAAVADRHGVPVSVPRSFSGVADSLPVETVAAESALADTPVAVHPVIDNRFWQEVALYHTERSILWVPEAVGTAPYFRAGDERLGVHPMLRLVPPREALGSFEPDRIQVGHGPGITTDARTALSDALAGARRRTPRLVGETLRAAAPVG